VDDDDDIIIIIIIIIILIPASEDIFHKSIYKCCYRNFKEFSAHCIHSTNNISELLSSDCTADYNYTILNM
jgi:hypothetical protein